jgi:ABC-type glycerol-3-phosphate transport system substrate-binding protein
MNPLKPLLFCAFLGALPTAAWSETVIRILHIQSNPQIRAIWQGAAQQYESAHPGVKVQFDYLENEAFKAKLPTLLQSKDRPSAFQSWGGGVMNEQVNSGICQDITKAVSEGGFTNPEVLKAFQLYKDFAALQPFQKGYLSNTYAEAAGTFHDGKAAFHLMGTWDLIDGRANATDKKGLPDEKLGWIFFPEVKGGKGKANDLFASLNGWLVAKQAPKETVDFTKVWLGKDTQTKLAEQGLFIPAVKGTAAAIQNPLMKAIGQEVDKSQWIAIAMDQLLGPDTGRVFNDVSADIASGNTAPEKATKAIEASWKQNKMQ